MKKKDMILAFSPFFVIQAGLLAMSVLGMSGIWRKLEINELMHIIWACVFAGSVLYVVVAVLCVLIAEK